jgi:hypothetical protein
MLRGGIMSAALTCLLVISGAITAVLVVLVIYGNALDSREDEEIYLNKTDERIKGGEQRVLVGKMDRLARVITVVAVLAGIFLLASAGVWAYIGLYRS